MRIIAFIENEHSIKGIIKSQGISDFLVRWSLGVVGQALPPIPKFIDAAEAIKELTLYDSLDPLPNNF